MVVAAKWTWYDPKRRQGHNILCPNSSEPLMSDGCIICSHSDLLKNKTRPNTGREYDSRGSTRFTL